MRVEVELVKIEVSRILKEKMEKYMGKIIDDFNEENNGVVIGTIEMQNIHYEMYII